MDKIKSLRKALNAAELQLECSAAGSEKEAAALAQCNELRAQIVTATMAAQTTTYRIDFTHERNGKAVRKSIEGTNLPALMRRVEKLDAYQINVLTETR